jgi:hypothetical protein
MSSDAEVNNTADTGRGKDIASVGIIGVCLPTIIEKFITDASWQKMLILCVPFFSICITEIFKWLLGAFGPQNAEKIRSRRLLDQKQKIIEIELIKPNISENHKEELNKQLEGISLARINSFDN